jgi:hypothetical protein
MGAAAVTWAPNYCTDEDLETYLRVSDEVDTVQMALAVTAASRAVDRFCNRQFGRTGTTEARYYTARWDARRAVWVVDIDDLMTVGGISVAVDLGGDQTYSYPITAYDFKPLNAVAKSMPWTELVIRRTSATTPNFDEDGVKVTAMWGWNYVPDTIVQATLMQANRLIMRRDSPYGVAGSAQAGSEIRLLAKVDPDVELLLRPYRRVWSAVGSVPRCAPNAVGALFGWH